MQIKESCFAKDLEARNATTITTIEPTCICFPYNNTYPSLYKYPLFLLSLPHHSRTSHILTYFIIQDKKNKFIRFCVN